MLRRAFYLAVALLAFGIGLFFVGRFYWQQDVPLEIEMRSVWEIKTSEDAPSLSVASGEERRICSRISKEDYFEPAISRWLKGKKIRAKPMSPPTDYQSCDIGYLASLMDVNQDGKKELMIKMDCPPFMINCFFVIYEKQEKGYKEIFSTRTHSIKLGKASNRDYLDIEAETWQSRGKEFHSVYKFDGERYNATECSQYSFDEKGNENIKPIECGVIENETLFQD